MDSAISDLCSKIQSATGLSVGIGQPGSVDSQLVLWPWRVSLDRSDRNMPSREEIISPEERITVFVLLLSKDGLTNLAHAAKAISANAVLTSGESRYLVREHELSEEFQVALLHAAGVPLQPVLCYAVVGQSVLGLE